MAALALHPWKSIRVLWICFAMMKRSAVFNAFGEALREEQMSRELDSLDP